MDSRTREKPQRTFDLVLKVECPATENEEPALLWKFPEDFSDKDILCMVPKFCFPFAIERVTQTQVGQHFTFVLTDIESKQRFGFCRLTSGGKICLCILSYLPWFEVYYKLLNTLAEYLVKEQEDDLNDMLKSLYTHPVPDADTPVNLSLNQQLFISSEQVLKNEPAPLLHSYFITPDVTRLPTIPESRNLTEYFVAVDVTNMLQLYASMLNERRIIITSRKLSTLTACVHASASLLFPMYWQHIYIPVLPAHLLDYCCAPMPYIIGVHCSLMERVRSRTLDDIVLLNVDTNSLETPFNDLGSLPSEVVSELKSKLKKQSTATGDGVARAFLRAQAVLFGSYRDALRYKPGEPVTFCEESFVRNRASSMQPFLETAVNLQLFKQFIDGRLEKLNTGRGFSDIFEDEITSGNAKSYQQWMQTVKKGGALINTAMVKASPAMKNVYKFAKSQAKLGIREVKNKLQHKEIEEQETHNEEPARSKTHPSNTSTRRKLSQTRRNLPITHVNNLDSHQDDYDAVDNASKVSSEDSEEASGFYDSNESSDDVSQSSRPAGEMDLLGEILDSLSTHSSEPGRLTAAKSLDFFRSMEDFDFKSLNKPNAPTENNLGTLGGETNAWNLGQDDSVLYGKHLPPSPRKPVSTLRAAQEESGYRGRACRQSEFPTVLLTDTSPDRLLGRPNSFCSTLEAQRPRGRRDGNSYKDETVGSPGGAVARPVPWEKDGLGFRGPPGRKDPS